MRPGRLQIRAFTDKFQSTHPVWGATAWATARRLTCCYFNPRTPCGVRRVVSVGVHIAPPISIHAPRVGCDRFRCSHSCNRQNFNPRTPCGVRQWYHLFYDDKPGKFQSTHPVWGATKTTMTWVLTAGFQSTHPVWGATMAAYASASNIGFQSTHPVWGATCPGRRVYIGFNISIHAPRVGCDGTTRWSWGMQGISIHAPRVGCDFDVLSNLVTGIVFQSTHPVWGATPTGPPAEAERGFQSTHPVWGATGSTFFAAVSALISIHAPRVGCDWDSLRRGVLPSYFNPRTPCGVRLGLLGNTPIRWNFNPRTPCGVRHFARVHGIIGYLKFQSTHPVWGATIASIQIITLFIYFNPRTPCGVRRGRFISTTN